MTISLAQNAARVSYSVSEGATQTSFTVSFEFFDDADLNVYVDGTKKTLTTHYSVSGGSGSTGAVAISVTGATGGSTVVITRDIALARTTDFPTSGSFQIATLNTELDRFTAIAADLKDSVDRSLQLTDFDSAVSLVLPAVADRKGRVLAFNASTGAVEAGASVSAVQSVADNAAAVNLLGTAAVVEDMGLLATAAVIEDMSILGTAAVVEDMGLLATSAVIEDIGLLATSAVIEDMGLLGTSANVTAMGLLGNSTVITNMSNLSASAVIADMAILGTTDVVSDMNTLATSDIVSDMNTLATSANVTAMGLLGTSAVVEDMGFLGTAAVVEDMGILGTSANVTAMSNVSGSISNVNTVASNISGVNDFAARYRVGSSDPSSNNDDGDLFYNTTSDALKVYNAGASAWQAGVSLGSTPTFTSQTTGQINNTDAFPDIRPSLLLDFANSKTLDPRITFTRGSTATYYDGKTTAKAEENLTTRSQEFNNWSLTNGTVTADSTTAPDGTTTADTFTATGANANISLTKTYGDDGDATFSVYIKRKTGTGNVEISHTIFGTATVVSVTSDWQRFEVTTTLSSASRSFGIELVTSGDEVYLWGAQLEQRSSATAYTPTTSSPIVKYQPVLQTAASGEARFDHDPLTGESKGLLIEEARTNILLYSADFTNSAWLLGDNTTREGYTIAPDGSHNAVVVSGDGGGSQLFIRHQVSLAANTTYTFSAFAKRTHGTASTSGQILNVQYSNGSGTNTRSLVAVTNLTSEWVRYSTTVTNVEAYTGTMYLAVDTNSDSENIAVWGAQVEAGSFPTSYIATSGSTVTRAVDAAAITGSNFTDWYSNANGLTILAQIGDKGAIDSGDDQYRRIYTIGDGTVDNYFTLHGQPSGGYWRYRMDSLAIDNAVLAAAYTGVSIANNQKVAVAFDTNDFAISVAGLAPQTDSSFPMPTLTKLLIGANEGGGANVLIGTIKKIAFYPKRLSNATLQAMTTE